jgi:hypothetical protein
MLLEAWTNANFNLYLDPCFFKQSGFLAKFFRLRMKEAAKIERWNKQAGDFVPFSQGSQEGNREEERKKTVQV